MALKGNPKEAIGKTFMVKGGADNPVGVCIRGTTRRTSLGENITNTKGEGGVWGYQVGGSNMEGMRDSAGFKAEEGGGST